MNSQTSVTARMIVLLAFLAAMPVLALPAVSSWIEVQLFGALGQTSHAAPDPVAIADTRNEREVLPSPLPRPAEDSPVPRTPSEKIADSIDRKSFARLPPTTPHVDPLRYQAVQQRLQELGVDYFIIEKTASDVASFRCHCRIAVPGSEIYARPFEVTDADPLRAMERVLSDVETWCASQQNGRRTMR